MSNEAAAGRFLKPSNPQAGKVAPEVLAQQTYDYSCSLTNTRSFEWRELEGGFWRVMTSILFTVMDVVRVNV